MLRQRNANKEYYLATWTAMFREILGWSAEETARWAARWTDQDGSDPLDDEDDIFYHETPQYWARSALIPDTLRDRLPGGAWLELWERVLEVFWDEHRGEFPPDTDWQPYRERVERILADYGASLPTVAVR